MKTISKNARLRLTALVFGVALISGVESKAMDKTGLSKKDKTFMDMLSYCYEKYQPVDRKDALNFNVLQKNVDKMRNRVYTCLEELPKDVQKFAGVWPEQERNWVPRETAELLEKTMAKENSADIIMQSDIVPKENQDQALMVSQAAKRLRNSIKLYLAEYHTFVVLKERERSKSYSERK